MLSQVNFLTSGSLAPGPCGQIWIQLDYPGKSCKDVYVRKNMI